ncbi:MAG: tryptophan--tRNA ligase [Acidobacteriota bacterium]
MKQRVLSGMQPTGQLHLGNYFGALKKWVEIQDSYECFYCIVDWHALTTAYQDSSAVADACMAVAADWLAAGLDPEKCVMFVQSHVPEHAELHLLLSMVTPVAWLERVPTYKEKQQELTGKDLSTYGFLGYPLLQTADIILYKAGLVPVGEDQVPHLELAREITRRFNSNFGEVFPEPQALLSPVPKLRGTDGRKMSKSYNNSILMAEEPADLDRKIKPMMTDPRRKRRTDPGEPDDCPVFDLHRVFTEAAKQEEVAHLCRTAGFGCLDCKGILLERMHPIMDPMKQRRDELLKQPERIREILRDGAARARKVAEETMEQVRAAIGLLRA